MSTPPRRIPGRLLPLLACSLIALVPVTGRAALFEDDEARKAIIELRAKVNEQNRQIEALKGQLADLSARLEPALRGMLDQQNQAEALRQEIAKLRGALEVQTNELAMTQKRQRDSIGEIDSRIKKFEPTPVQVDGRTVAVDPAERRSYEASLAQFRAGDFKSAQAGFQQFVSQYPDSAYVQNAMFWLGSAQFALKDYKAAIATHQAFIAKYPDHPRAPDAMLNLAYAQIESGDRKTARTTLQTVTQRYADTPAAQAAKDRLASLK